MDLSKVYSFKPCMFVHPNLFNMKKHIFYYYVWKNELFEKKIKCLWLLCVHLSSIAIHLPSIGEKEVKRRGAEVLSFCEFRYSWCDSCCELSLATPHSKSTNPVWQSSVTSWPTSLVKQMSFATHNHSLMMITEMCIEAVFRNSIEIFSQVWFMKEGDASRNYYALSLASKKPHGFYLISHVL